MSKPALVCPVCSGKVTAPRRGGNPQQAMAVHMATMHSRPQPRSEEDS